MARPVIRWLLAAAAATRAQAQLPAGGAQKLLVVLVDFIDSSGILTPSYFHDQFFGAGGLSEYFRVNSNGKLTLSGDVVGLQGGAGMTVVNSMMALDYVRLPHESAYYFGFALEDGSPCLRSTMVTDTLRALDQRGFDFSEYATNGVLEGLVILPALTSSGNFVGSIQWHYTECMSRPELAIQDPNPEITWEFNLRSATVKRFALCWAQDQPTSVGNSVADCIPQVGELLGLPSANDVLGRQPHAPFADMGGSHMLGWFSLMSTNGQRPLYASYMSPSEKLQLGWITPQNVVPTEQEVEYKLDAANVNPSVLQVQVDGSRDVFLLENRQRLLFNQQEQQQKEADGFCPGVAVYLVDNYVTSLHPDMPQEMTFVQHPALLVRKDVPEDFQTHQVDCGDTWQEGSVLTGETSEFWSGFNSGLHIRFGGADANGAVSVFLSRETPTTKEPVAVEPAAATEEAAVEEEDEDDSGCDCSWTVEWGCGEGDGSFCWNVCCDTPPAPTPEPEPVPTPAPAAPVVEEAKTEEAKTEEPEEPGARVVHGCDCSWATDAACGGEGDGSICWLACCRDEYPEEEPVQEVTPVQTLMTDDDVDDDAEMQDDSRLAALTLGQPAAAPQPTFEDWVESDTLPESSTSATPFVCECGWASPDACGFDDGSLCYGQCCLHEAPGARDTTAAPKDTMPAGEEKDEGVSEVATESDCDCSWTQDGANCGGDDGSVCWKDCCGQTQYMQWNLATPKVAVTRPVMHVLGIASMASVAWLIFVVVRGAKGSSTDRDSYRNTQAFMREQRLLREMDDCDDGVASTSQISTRALRMRDGSSEEQADNLSEPDSPRAVAHDDMDDSQYHVENEEIFLSPKAIDGL